MSCIYKYVYVCVCVCVCVCSIWIPLLPPRHVRAFHIVRKHICVCVRVYVLNRDTSAPRTTCVSFILYVVQMYVCTYRQQRYFYCAHTHTHIYIRIHTFAWRTMYSVCRANVCLCIYTCACLCGCTIEIPLLPLHQVLLIYSMHAYVSMCMYVCVCVCAKWKYPGKLPPSVCSSYCMA